MLTFIWLVFTTAIGWAVGQYAFDTPYPLICAVIGFAVGGIIRVLPKVAVEAADVIGDIF